jgi:hypothetical protein
MRHGRWLFWMVCAAASPGAVREQQGPMRTPADGHTIHVLAPHVVDGQVMGPFHHYCKVISPEPVIECLIYESTDTLAPLEQIEYIVAKTITRTKAISLDDWNRNWHDHTQEITTGRMRVLDLPPDEARNVASLVGTTDGIIFHLWSRGDRVPNGRPIIAQSVGHASITMAEKMNRGRTP